MPGTEVRDEVDPPGRPLRREPLVEGEAGGPGRELLGAHRRPREEVALAVVSPGKQPVGEQDAEERDEDRAEQEQEGLVGAQVDHDRADGRGRRDGNDQEPLREPRQHVLDRHGGRVDVREGLVRFVHRQRQQREGADRAAGRHRGGDVGGVADVAGEHEQDAEPEAPERRDEVADPDSPEGGAAVA